jgi:hypothetical protein
VQLYKLAGISCAKLGRQNNNKPIANSVLKIDFFIMYFPYKELILKE